MDTESAVFPAGKVPPVAAGFADDEPLPTVHGRFIVAFCCPHCGRLGEISQIQLDRPITCAGCVGRLRVTVGAEKRSQRPLVAAPRFDDLPPGDTLPGSAQARPALRVLCPQCDEVHELDELLRGKHVLCRTCRARFVVPSDCPTS